MSHISEARECLEKIKKSIVYSRAKDYYSALMEIYRKANKSDASTIHVFVKEADEFMKNMPSEECNK